MILIDNIIPTQNELRSQSTIDEWKEKFKNGLMMRGVPAKLTRFEDGLVFCHDGHHRIRAAYEAGLSCLHTDEYRITDMKYSDYVSPNISNGWYTPFNPKHEVRISDLTEFKRNVKIQLSSKSVMILCWFIENHRTEYVRPRSVWHIKEMTL